MQRRVFVASMAGYVLDRLFERDWRSLRAFARVARRQELNEQRNSYFAAWNNLQAGWIVEAFNGGVNELAAGMKERAEDWLSELDRQVLND